MSEIFGKQITISSSKNRELIDITAEVERFVKESKVCEGQITIFTPHATAAILINENEEGLKSDFEKIPEILLPRRQAGAGNQSFAHDKIDDNAVAHLAAGIIGPSETIIIKDGQLQLGTWQQIFLFELDGPRQTRKINLQIISSQK